MPSKKNYDLSALDYLFEFEGLSPFKWSPPVSVLIKLMSAHRKIWVNLI